MHLRPAGIEMSTNGLELGTLPDDLTPTKVMGDFLRYLYTEALEYIKTHHIDGREIIDEVGDNKSDRKSTRLNSSHSGESRMPSSA